MIRRHALPPTTMVAVLASATVAARAQVAPAAEKKVPKWSDAAELSLVATSGNSESNSFAFKNTLLREGKNGLFELKLGGLKVETTTISLSAEGTPPNVDRVEDKDRETTAENYYLTGRYDRNIAGRFFWFAGAGWDRNEFAGIENRYVGFGGFGHNWFDTDRRKWRTDYSATGTKQDNVLDDPDFDDTFFGIRLSSTFLQKFGAHDVGTFGNDTIIDENLNETKDWRVNMTNWVALNLSSHLALKVSLQWLYDNLPSFKEVDLFDPADPGNTTDTHPVELDDLDTLFTTALVIKY